MSFGGILAGAIGAGAGAGAYVAREQIDKNNKLDIIKQASDVEEMRAQRLAQFQQRLARDNHTYNTTGQGATELLAYDQRKGEQTNEAEVKRQELLAKLETQTTAARGTDQGYLKGLAAQAAAKETPTELAKANASIAASKASAAASYASAANAGRNAELLGVQLDVAKLGLGDLKELDSLTDQIVAIQNDTTLDPTAKQAKLAPLERSVQAIKSKSEKSSTGRNPELDYETVEEEIETPNGTRTVTSKRVRRPGVLAGGEGGQGGGGIPLTAPILDRMVKNMDNPTAVAEFKALFGDAAFTKAQAVAAERANQAAAEKAQVRSMREQERQMPVDPLTQMNGG